MKLSHPFCKSILPLTSLAIAGLLSAASQFAWGNPTGGTVTSGSASISNSPGSTTVNQSSTATVINWQTFSINHGETTQFFQPSAQSAALNRVLGGGTSQINGSLTANGQIYLINQNGIVVGPGGIVNAAGGFTASTRDISTTDFLKGNAHFVGHGNAGVKNLGQISSSLGNVVLIGKTVANQGQITAAKGTAGLVAGDDVLLGQTNADGSTITVSPSPLATAQLRKTAVSNTGTITSTAAELKAANGNIYAMAINNGGTIRATTVLHQGGHIFLNSDSGSIINSGTLDASATALGGQGGTVQLKSGGSVSHTGTILAHGGQGGAGGSVDISGSQLAFTGLVDLTSPGGSTGQLLLDPTTLEVISGGVGGISSGENDSNSTIDPNTVDAALNSANITLNANNAITISIAITWGSSNTLTLSTNTSGSTISVNAPISGGAGTLAIRTAGSSDMITPGLAGSINVGTFLLQNGYWNQNANGGDLPGFAVGSDFEIQGSSTFLRVIGGTGASSSPYLISDIYGLQGIGSPSNAFVFPSSVHDYQQTGNIDASGTATWNGGEGFSPIGGAENGFEGTYNGNGYTINNLTINRPSSYFVGIFGNTIEASFSNVGIVNGSITGSTYVGGLIGFGSNSGSITNCYFTGSVTGNGQTGGLAGVADSFNIQNCFSSGSVTGSDGVGGLIGGASDGHITNSYSTSTVVASTSSNGGNPESIGGLVGSNSAKVSGSYATGHVRVSGTDGSFIGALTGINSGSLHDCYATGAVSVDPYSEYFGGLVGLNEGRVSNSHWYPLVGKANAYNNAYVAAQAAKHQIARDYGYDFAYDYAFEVSLANAKAVPFNAAFAAAHLAKNEDNFGAAYNFAYDYAFEVSHAQALANAYSAAFEVAYKAANP